jgi:hypothetical protein
MGRRKPRKRRHPNPLRLWNEAAPALHTWEWLQAVTERLPGRKRIWASTLSAYGAGRTVPGDYNAETIEIATCGRARADGWYEPCTPTRFTKPAPARRTR